MQICNYIYFYHFNKTKAPYLRIYKDYAITVQNSIKRLCELDPKQEPLLCSYLDEKKKDPVCRGLEIGSYISSPSKRNYI